MDYFIGRGIGGTLTGIERAQLMRLALFKAHNRPAKILRFSYTRTAHADSAEYGLEDTDLCNMFDFYQEAEQFPARVFSPDMVQPKGSKAVLGGTQGELQAVNFMVAGKPVRQVRYNKRTNQVEFVLDVDDRGRVTNTDSYDSRGFMSRRSLMNGGGHQVADQYFTPAGKMVLRIGYNGDTQHGMQGITLADGTKFKDTTALEAHFLQQLATREPSRFFFDRDAVGKLITQLDLPGLKFDVVHNNHHGYDAAMSEAATKIWREFGVRNKVKSGSAPYSRELADPGNLDAFIVSTHQQAADLRTEFPDLPPIVVAPVGVATTLPKPVDFASRRRKRLLVVSRLSPEKGLQDVIDAFIAIHNTDPEVTMDVYGQPNGSVGNVMLQKFNQQLLKAGAGSAVRFMGFRQEMGQAYDEAGVFVMTSATEGFNIAMQEAVVHGVPVVSYDIKYGPQDMVQQGINGLLTPAKNVPVLAATIADVLRKPDYQARLSQGAYRTRKAFGGDAVWAQYQQLPDNQ